MFSNCSNLSTVTINSNHIISKAYTQSSSLKMVFGNQVTNYIIGSDVTNIGAFAFYDCTSLTSLTCNATTPPTLGYDVFGVCNNLSHIYVPAESVDAYKAASGWSDKASIIEAIPVE